MTDACLHYLFVIILTVFCLLRAIESGGKPFLFGFRISYWNCYLINNPLLPANNLHMLDGVSSAEIIGGDVFFEITDPPELEYTFRLRPAKNFGGIFNASFKLQDVMVILAEPEDACEGITNYDHIPGQVVLVERGKCSFLEKAIQAERVGAAAVIITDSWASEEDLEYYIEMVHDNSGRDCSIPAGYLLGKNGKMIRRTLQSRAELSFTINIPVNLTFVPPHEINHPPWLGW